MDNQPFSAAVSGKLLFCSPKIKPTPGALKVESKPNKKGEGIKPGKKVPLLSVYEIEAFFIL